MGQKIDPDKRPGFSNPGFTRFKTIAAIFEGRIIAG